MCEKKYGYQTIYVVISNWPPLLLFSGKMKKNKKYEDLLLKSYEKYRGIAVIDKYHDCETNEIGEEIETVLPWRTDKTTRSISPRNGPQKHGNYFSRKYRVFYTSKMIFCLKQSGLRLSQIQFLEKSQDCLNSLDIEQKRKSVMERWNRGMLPIV